LTASESGADISEVINNKIGRGPCKMNCIKFKATKPATQGRYLAGQVRCMICDIFMTRDGCVDKHGQTATPDIKGLFCRCCGYRVRTKPRATKYKERLNKRL